MDKCKRCGSEVTLNTHVEMPLFETGTDDAIVKTVSFCQTCLDVRVVDMAYVPSSTLSAHA